MRLQLTAEAISASNLAFVLSDGEVDEFGAGRRPPVAVTVNGVTFRGRVASMGGRNLIGLTKANRAATGVDEGVTYDVEVVLDAEQRTVTVPDELVAAFVEDPTLRQSWDAWSYTRRREAAASVEGAKKPETRARRVAATLDGLRQA